MIAAAPRIHTKKHIRERADQLEPKLRSGVPTPEKETSHSIWSTAISHGTHSKRMRIRFRHWSRSSTDRRGHQTTTTDNLLHRKLKAAEDVLVWRICQWLYHA
jgi:hypothetical protein